MQRANEELSTNIKSQTASPTTLTQSLSLLGEGAGITPVLNLIIAIIEKNFAAVDNLLKNPDLQKLITEHEPRSSYDLHTGDTDFLEEARTYLELLEQLQSKIRGEENQLYIRHLKLKELISNTDCLSQHLILRAAVDVIGTSNNSQDLTILERLLDDRTIASPSFQDQQLETDSLYTKVFIWENNALCKAISLQNKAVIRKLLSVSPSLFSSNFLFNIDKESCTNSLRLELNCCYLFFAMKVGADLEIVDMLLNSAANQNILQNPEELITVLIHALEMKRMDFFNFVLAKNENFILDNACIFNSSLLFAAIKNNHIEFLAKALKHPTIIDNINNFGASYWFLESHVLCDFSEFSFQQDNVFKTLLIMAAQYDRKEIVALILDIPQALTNQDILSAAASIALRYKSKDSYDTLMMHPAVKDAINNNTRLLCTAIELGKTDIVQSLIKLESIQQIIHHVVVEQGMHNLSNPLIDIKRINPSTQIINVLGISVSFNLYENPLITAAKYASTEIFDMLLTIPGIGDNNDTFLQAIYYATSNIHGNYLINKLLALEKAHSYIQNIPAKQIEYLLISILRVGFENDNLFNILLECLKDDNNFYIEEVIAGAIINSQTKELSALLKLEAAGTYLQSLTERGTYNLIFSVLKANSNSIFTTLLTNPVLSSKVARLPCNLLIDLTGNAALNCTAEIFNKLLNILGEPALLNQASKILYVTMIGETLIENMLKANRLTICLRYLDDNLIDYLRTQSPDYWLYLLNIATCAGNFSFQYALICKILDRVESHTLKLSKPSLSQEERQYLTSQSNKFEKVLGQYVSDLNKLIAPQIRSLDFAINFNKYRPIGLNARAIAALHKSPTAINAISLAQYTAYRALQSYNSPWAIEIKKAVGANLNSAINLINGIYYEFYQKEFTKLSERIYNLIPKSTAKSEEDKLRDKNIFNRIDAKVSYKIMQFSNPYYQQANIQLKDNIEYINQIANLLTFFNRESPEREFTELETDAVIYFFIKNNNDKKLANLVLLENPRLTEEEEAPKVKTVKLTNKY